MPIIYFLSEINTYYKGMNRLVFLTEVGVEKGDDWIRPRAQAVL